MKIISNQYFNYWLLIIFLKFFSGIFLNTPHKKKTPHPLYKITKISGKFYLPNCCHFVSVKKC